MKKDGFFLLLIGLILLSIRATAHAQTGPSCTQVVGNGCNYGYTSGPCPGWFNCESPGPWLVVCTAMTSQCAPPSAAAETHCSTCSHAGSPIDLSTGNTFIDQTDLTVPGLGGGLNLARRWNSIWPSTQTAFRDGIFGRNWRSTYEERVFVGSDNYIKYARADGSFWSFGVGGTGWKVAAPANAGASLNSGITYWTLTLKSGEKRLFDNASGNLLAIIDRNGNRTQISYDGGGRLASVTDAASRHLYFNYVSDSSFLVASVTSDFGMSVSYEYDDQHRLIRVTEPDGSTITFQYDSNSYITGVLDSAGKILESHTYDSIGRGLTSSRANGVDAVTLSY